MTSTSSLPEPDDVLYRIKRGLAGYVSYLAACEMNEAFSEHVLYEPILRVLTARGYAVECEAPCPGIKQPTTGDKKKIDFVAAGHERRFALEVKWAQSQSLDVTNDYVKLKAFRNVGAKAGERAFLCIFGRKSNIEGIALKQSEFLERGSTVIANLGKTRFGCRVFEVVSPKQALPENRGQQKTKSKRSRPVRG